MNLNKLFAPHTEVWGSMEDFKQQKVLYQLECVDKFKDTLEAGSINTQVFVNTYVKYRLLNDIANYSRHNATTSGRTLIQPDDIELLIAAEDITHLLTEKQLLIYIMHLMGYQQKEIAELLDVSRQHISQTMRRVGNKIEGYKDDDSTD